MPKRKEAALQAADNKGRGEPVHTIDRASRSRFMRKAGTFAIGAVMAVTLVPAVASAMGGEGPETVIPQADAIPVFVESVSENPAFRDPGYLLQARTVSDVPMGPVFMEAFGPAYEPEMVMTEVFDMPAEPAAPGKDIVLTAMAEYPVAAQVYDRLSNEGWSDVCIAGVVGNMMTECGGQTLVLDPYCDYLDRGVRYYGLCQWSMTYHKSVDGLDIDGQMDYLMGNIEYNMAYFGRDDSTYADWLGSTDAAQAARDFCRYYERGEGTETRAANAVTAYSWIQAAKTKTA